MNREPIVIDTNVLISFALSSTTTPALAVEYAINNFIILRRVGHKTSSPKVREVHYTGAAPTTASKNFGNFAAD